MKIREIADRLGCSDADATAFLKEQGITATQISDRNIGDVAKEFGSKTLATVGSEIQVMPVAPVRQPAASVDPSELLATQQQRALDAATKAAATMGDSTSGLFGKVEQKLGEKRFDRDEQLAEQIAQQVFDMENETLGKSFTALLGWVEKFDPYKGTPLEGVTGSGTINISALMSGKQ